MLSSLWSRHCPTGFSLSSQNCVFWLTIFNFDLQICQAGILISFSKWSHDLYLENPTENTAVHFTFLDEAVKCCIQSPQVFQWFWNEGYLDFQSHIQLSMTHTFSVSAFEVVPVRYFRYRTKCFHSPMASLKMFNLNASIDICRMPVIMSCLLGVIYQHLQSVWQVVWQYFFI